MWSCVEERGWSCLEEEDNKKKKKNIRVEGQMKKGRPRKAWKKQVEDEGWFE